MIFIAFRRGNYGYKFASMMSWGYPYPPSSEEEEEATATTKKGCFQRVFRHAVADSWMICALVFTRDCAPNNCKLCAKSSDRGVSLHRSRGGPHLLHLGAFNDDGVQLLVDEPFDNNDAWSFVRLDDGCTAAAWAFSQEVQGMNYNRRGSIYNFVPRVMRPWWGGLVRVGRDNVVVPERGLFCSEMATTFLRTHVYPGLDLTPCETTPQQLLDALLAYNPSLTQRMLSGSNKLSSMFVV